MRILFILSPLLLDTIVLLKYNTKKRITFCIEIESITDWLILFKGAKLGRGGWGDRQGGRGWRVTP
jgi:hypothetical protein